jgi:excinuclease UvrABC helicase subunit UvrB
LQGAIWAIQQDLVKQVDYFKRLTLYLEAKRLEERTNFDLEMIQNGLLLRYIIPTRATLTARSWHKTILLTGLFPKIS